MNKRKIWLSILAFPMLQLSTAVSVSAADYMVSDIALTPGSNASELNFAWITDEWGTGECLVQITNQLRMEPGANRFRHAGLFVGTKAEATDGVADYFYCEATVTGLNNQQRYSYRLGDSGSWSDTYQYSTENRNRYGVVYLADVQIGASDVTEDTESWVNNAELIINQFPDTAFILSAGDQIETPGSEDQWSGFLSPAELRSIPVVPTPAAHDELGTGRGGYVSSYAFDYHFNLPNEAERHIITGDINDCGPKPDCVADYVDLEAAAGDYYFTYGDALYMVLNMDSVDYAQHESFIETAIEASPEAKWKIVMYHYTIYTAATRSPFIDRDTMSSMMEDNAIDLVLQGHDHTYCRTYPMLDGVAQEEVFNEKGESLNPEGVVYFTANSASGSKYYTLDPDASTLDYVAAYNQDNVPTFSYIDVDANGLKITTYKTESMEVIDTYTMLKSTPPQPNHNGYNHHH